MSKDKIHSWNPNLRRSAGGPKSVTQLIEELLKGDRLALAQALTLVEDQRPQTSSDKSALLQGIFPLKKPYKVIGVTGAPGVGKSTAIEAMGLDFIKRGFKVAVLTIDPTSRATGGSILGDKTRMPKLSINDQAYIRPSPSGEVLGGVARSTYLSTLICGAAGYDLILIETVGVGQSEIEVSQMCDLFVLLLEPGAGDDLQGIKRGIMELADLVLITKSDTKPSIAKETKRNYSQALHLMRNKAHGQPSTVLLHDSFNDALVRQSADKILSYHAELNQTGYISSLRKEQSEYQLSKWIQYFLINELKRTQRQSEQLNTLREKLSQGKIDSFTVAYETTRNV